MARIPKLDSAGRFLAADVNAQIDARTKATMRADLPALAEELKIGGSDGGTGSRSVSGTVKFTTEDQALPPFVVATTTGATVEGVTLTAGQMAAFWYLNGAWHVMVHGQDTAWRSTAKPDTRIAVNPIAPTFTNDTTNGGGTWTTSSQAGVRFTPASGTATPGQKVTVTASLSDPTKYKFASGAQTTWTFTFLDPFAPIADDFAGAAGVLLAGRATPTGGVLWSQSGTTAQWKLDGTGGVVPSVTTASVSNTLATTSNVMDITVTYSDRVGRFDFGFGLTTLVIATMDLGNSALFVGGAVAGETPKDGSTSGTLRLRYDGSTVTAYKNGVQFAQKTGVTPPTEKTFAIRTNAAGDSVRLSALSLTPVKVA